MKHLKKDDGYVLIYVLVAFTILSFVAVSICTTALNSLKTQKADVARMEARYAAEGELQKFVAQVTARETTETVGDGDIEAAEAAAESAFRDAVADIAEELPAVEVDADGEEVEITAMAKKAGYVATIQAKAQMTLETTGEEGNSEVTCTMTAWEYTAYDISYEKEEVSG